MSTDDLRFDEHGLLPVVAQDRLTGEVRMLAWANREAVARTIESGLATFWSRSRGTLWQKGETSGNALRVHAVHADCDGDALLLSCDPVGPSCHTGQRSCFFRPLEATGRPGSPQAESLPFLAELEREIDRRSASTADRSYTRALLDQGPGGIADKVREEADEFGRALEAESDERVASEAADVVYHLMVGLRARGVGLRQVVEVLSRRAGTSGHAEKAGRAAR
jgi:phosphoribosyl-ATP pyrophosphohydrolase/phosphoribosyl-AMP cyclohydrolase